MVALLLVEKKERYCFVVFSPVFTGKQVAGVMILRQFTEGTDDLSYDAANHRALWVD
jgi:hypothetical protein